MGSVYPHWYTCYPMLNLIYFYEESLYLARYINFIYHRCICMCVSINLFWSCIEFCMHAFLPFTVHAARSSASFLGNGSILLICLNITDHTISIVLVSELFAGHRRTPIVASLRKPWLILAVWGFASPCVKADKAAFMCGLTYVQLDICG